MALMAVAEALARVLECAVPLATESAPLADAHGQEKWVDVNLTTQTARAMIGGQAVYTALVSTGAPDFPSPTLNAASFGCC